MFQEQNEGLRHQLCLGVCIGKEIKHHKTKQGNNILSSQKYPKMVFSPKIFPPIYN